MAVKTKDYTISVTENKDDYIFSFNKNKNALYIKGIEEEDIDLESFRINDDDILLFSTFDGKNFTVLNYKAIKYIKTNDQNSTKLLDIISNNLVDNTQNIITKYDKKKLTATGTNYNDKIDLSESNYAPSGKTNIKNNKGLTISAGSGNDEIVATDYNDIIKGGNGDDTITGGEGNDAISGGSGKTVVNYTKGDGNDIINLTKGEEFTLNIFGVDSINDLKFEYANKNKDLRIYTDKNTKDEYITIKDIAAKNVVSATGKVEINVNGKIFDVLNPMVDNEIYLYKTILPENASNFTGTYLNDEIDAQNAKFYKTIGKGKNKQIVEKEAKDAGLTLKGGAGDDTIIGTKYSDTIYGNSGNDTITGSIGNDKMYGEAGYNTFIFNNGDGKDIVYSGSGEDTLKFNNIKLKELSFEKNITKTVKDLIIKYNEGQDSVTVKDYYKTNKKNEYTTSVKWIEINGKIYSLAEIIEKYEQGQEEVEVVYLPKPVTVRGLKGDDTIITEIDNSEIFGDEGYNDIFVNSNNNTIHSGINSDTITISGKNNTIYTQSGNDDINFVYDDSEKTQNTVVLKNGDGADNIYTNGNNITLKFADIELSDIALEQFGCDLIIKYNSDSVTLKRYFYIDEENQQEEFEDNREEGIITLTDKNNQIKNLANFINDYENIPQYQGNEITGTDEDDYIELEYKEDRAYTIDAKNGNDTLILWNINNSTIDSGNGHDNILLANGNNNRILSGKGNDEIYILSGESNNETNNTVVLKNGDGNDIINVGANTTLEFFDVELSDLTLNRLGSDLIIKYNTDSATIRGYFNENDDYEDYVQPIITLKDKNNESIILDEFLENYNGIKNSNITEINGTSTDDKIRISNVNNITIDSKDGDDNIIGDEINNSTIYGGIGNDEIEVNGENNTIYGGKGNDYISEWEGDTNDTIIVFNNGDGDDTVSFWGGEHILKFADCENLSDLVFEKFSNDLLIKYNEGNDSVNVKNYFDLDRSFSIQGKTDEAVELSQLVPEIGTVPEATITQITGTENDDVYYEDMDNVTINCLDGDDEIGGECTTNNSTINGGNGNDRIYAHGVNNTIYGGKGNDRLYVRNSWEEYEGDEIRGSGTIVFNNGDGDDIVDCWHSDTVLKFTGSDDFVLQRYKTNLIIKYNQGNDSVTIRDFYTYDEEINQYVINFEDEDDSYTIYTIEKPDGSTILLSDFIQTYGDIPNANITEINGTSTDDKIRISNVNKITIDSKDGDDNVTCDEISNSVIYGGVGNDEIEINGENNTIYGGKGNDYISEWEVESSNTTIVFNNGDGDDTISFWSGEHTLKFADCTGFDSLSFKRMGYDLIIKYNQENDSVKIQEYFSGLGIVYSIQDSMGNSINLDNLLPEQYEDIPEYIITEISGTATDDKIRLTSYDFNFNNLNINLNSGDDELIACVDNSTIYGGVGNDKIAISGGNNTIYGEKGNDYFSDWEGMGGEDNTFVFNNGDGNDTISFGADNTVLYFADTNIEELVFENFYNTDLIIKYNNGSDSVRLRDYFSYGYIGADSLIIKDKNQYQTNLINILPEAGGISSFVGDTIKGTDENDRIYLFNAQSELEEERINYTIDAMGGNDKIFTDVSDSTILGGDGNDTIEIDGTNNIIKGEKGNDRFDMIAYTDGKNQNMIVLSNGDGNDILTYYRNDITLEFKDTNMQDINLYKNGSNLYLKYNDNKDSINLLNYFESDEEYYNYGEASIITLKDKNGALTDLNEFMDEHEEIQEYTAEDIAGSNEDDYILLKNPSSVVYNADFDYMTIVSGQIWGENDILNINPQSNEISDLCVLFNVDSDYSINDATEYEDLEFGDICILNKEDIEKWIEKENYKGVVIKNNTIGEINCDNKYLSSLDIAQVAQNVASWLSDNNYSDVYTALEADENNLNVLLGEEYIGSIEWKDVV